MSPLELRIRPARAEEADRIEAVQRASIRRLGRPYYSPAQIDGGLNHVGTLDPQLIADGTYYVAEVGGRIVGCGGWSYRPALHGANGAGGGTPPTTLDPAADAARIRAIFVHPDWARRGIARRLMRHAEAAAHRAGFRRFELLATLSGEPLYRALGYREIERVALELPDGTRFPVVRMAKEYDPEPQVAAAA